MKHFVLTTTIMFALILMPLAMAEESDAAPEKIVILNTEQGQYVYRSWEFENGSAVLPEPADSGYTYVWFDEDGSEVDPFDYMYTENTTRFYGGLVREDTPTIDNSFKIVIPSIMFLIVIIGVFTYANLRRR